MYFKSRDRNLTKDESLKKIIRNLYSMSQGASECIYLLQNAFIYHSSKFLDECEAKAKEIRLDEKALTRRFDEEARKNPAAKAYVPIPRHIEKIGVCIEELVGSMRKKIKEDILFSDKAVSEVTFLLQRIQEVLNNASDIILARNAYTGKYVKESGTEINRSANEFATMHEERLVEGLCTPKASPLFLDMLDTIKDIAWQAKEIAQKLTEC